MNISKHKKILLLLPTLNVQYLSTIIQTISVTWYILSKFGETESGLYLALYFFCFLVPQILVGPLLGVFVDKYDRKKIIIFTVYSRCISLLLLALFFLLNIFPIFFLFIIVMVNSIMNTFNISAINAVIPDIVKEEHLLNINSIISLNENLSFMVGAVIAGFLYSAVGMVGVFLITGVLYSLIGFFLFFLHIPNPTTKTIQSIKQGKNIQTAMTLKKIFLSLKEGFILIKKDKPIFFIILLGLMINFFLFPFDSILLPKAIKYILHFEADKYGVMRSIAYMGAIFGILMLSLIPKKNKLIYSIFIFATFALALNIIFSGILLSPASLKTIDNNTIYFLLCTLSFIRFTFDSLIMIPIKTIYQKRISSHLRGRFYGIMNTLWTGFQPIGSGIIGIITSIGYFSYFSIIITLGLLISVIAIIVFTSTEIRKMYLQTKFSINVNLLRNS